MATLLDIGIFSVEGLDGEVLPGAKLFFYLTGTSTKLATYADETLTVPNSNPVVADAAGRFPAIWLQNQLYKIVLTTASDTDPPTSPLMTRDNIGNTFQAEIDEIKEDIEDLQEDVEIINENLDEIPADILGPEFLGIYPRSSLSLNKAMMQAALSGSVKVAIVGDSIWEQADIAYSNSNPDLVQRMLATTFPNIEWEVTNFSIGGRSMANLANSGYVAPTDFTIAPTSAGAINSSYWPNGSTNGKSWRDHIKDYAPDLVILALGENDGTDVLPFSLNFQTFYDYSQTWTKKPWFTLVSSLLPTDSGIYVAQQQGKQSIADFMKYKAIEQGFGLIDANSVYRVLRDGIRRDLLPHTNELDFRYWGDASKWGVTGTLNLVANELTGDGLASRLISARDIDTGFVFELGTNDAVMSCSFRNTLTEAGFTVQANFVDGLVRLYYRASLVTFGSIANLTAGQSAGWRIKAIGPLIEVYFDDNPDPVISGYYPYGLLSGTFNVGLADGTGTISSFTLDYAGEFEAANPYFSELYLLGVNPSDWATNPDSAGGDGIHHPSTLGEYQIYVPAIAKWIDDLCSIVGTGIATTGPQTNNITSDAGGGVTVLTNTEVSVSLNSRRNVMCHIAFPYLNGAGGAGDGQIYLYVDGGAAVVWWLPVTTGANNRLFSASIPVELTKGSHTLALAWGGQAGMTSNATINDRSLAVVI